MIVEAGLSELAKKCSLQFFIIPDLFTSIEGYNMQSDIIIIAGKIGLLTSREAQTMSLHDIAQ